MSKINDKDDPVYKVYAHYQFYEMNIYEKMNQAYYIILLVLA